MNLKRILFIVLCAALASCNHGKSYFSSRVTPQNVKTSEDIKGQYSNATDIAGIDSIGYMTFTEESFQLNESEYATKDQSKEEIIEVRVFEHRLKKEHKKANRKAKRKKRRKRKKRGSKFRNYWDTSDLINFALAFIAFLIIVQVFMWILG